MGTSDGMESSFLSDLTGLQDPGSLAGFLEVAFDAVVTFDTQERITSWNPAAEKMFGWASKEALGKTPAELFWPVDVPIENENKKQRQAKLKGGESLRGELFPCRKDGSSFPAQFTARAIFDSDRKVEGYLAVYRDLSDAVQAREKEEQLRQSNQRLNQILASIQDDFYVLDRDWRFVFASRSFTSKIGKEPEDFAGHNIWEMFPKHVGGTLHENFHIAMEKREIRRFELPGKYTNAWYRMNVFPSEEGITVIGTDITERKKAEERLQRVLETDAVGVLFFDPDGCVIEANDVFLKMTGYRRDQVKQRALTWRKMTPPEWVADSEAQMEQFVQTGRIGPYEKEYLLADGSRRWMLFAGRAIGDGTIAEYCIDISDRKQAEQALRENQATLQSFYDSAPFLMGIVELEGDRTIAVSGNRAVADFFSVPPSDLPGQTGEEQGVLEQIRQLWLASYRKSQTEGAPVRFEYEHPHHAGPRWLRVTVAFIGPGPSGHPRFSFVAEDITERKRVEEERQKSERRYHLVGELIPFGVWEADREGNATYLSPLYLELTGQTLEKHRQSWQALIQADETNDLVRSWRDCVQSRSLWDREFHVRGRDGSYRAIHARGLPLYNSAGEITSYVGINFDITERKRVEEALRASEKELQMLNEALEQKVLEKTAEVRRLAADLVIAVQRERHRISHILHDDLQQRIYAIQMQMTFLGNELYKVNEAARNEALEIGKQLEEVLEITRKLSIDLSPPILQDEGLTQAIAWLAGQMQQRYGLPIEIQADGPFILPDEELQVLLFNCVRELLFNVVKHAEAGRAVVALQWPEDSLRIEVSDDGKGFPARVAEQQSAEEMSEDENLQLSFGLPTLRHQLSLFDGQMEIHSEPGAGTQVVLTIPVTKSR